jgi:hypothetical protein
VRFIEETGGRSKVFDFAGLPVSEPLRQWLAACFARQITTRSTVKRLATARSLVSMAHIFATVLAEHSVPVEHPQDIGAEHFVAFRHRHEHLKLRSLGSYVETLRWLLHGDEQLSPDARAGLDKIRVRGAHHGAQATADREYTDPEWQQIMTAVRHDVRVARDRIRTGQGLLARFRADDLDESSAEDNTLAGLLDVFDHTGDLPRYPSGGPAHTALKCGGLVGIARMLCLSPHELAAFALLLTGLTGQNFGSVVTWPAAHFRPDGGLSEQGLALVESCKPRRGPEREHMVIALEDVLTGEDRERRLFRSPLRVYRLLLELGDTARRLGGLETLFAGRISKTGVHARTPWIGSLTSTHVQRWAHEHGFPTATTAVPGGKPVVEVRRLRLTAIERRRRPVAHTATTMRDAYLMPSPTVREESRMVVSAALDSEVSKARAHCEVPVFTSTFMELAHRDPQAAAEKAGMASDELTRLVTGAGDTPLTSCRDHTASPYDPPGSPCSASFLACLDCVNARALPHQLPVQLAAIDALQALRPHLSPALWSRRYAPRLQQLREITGGFQPGEIEQARNAITAEHHRQVTDLLEGRWDLR